MAAIIGAQGSMATAQGLAISTGDMAVRSQSLDGAGKGKTKACFVIEKEEKKCRTKKRQSVFKGARLSKLNGFLSIFNFKSESKTSKSESKSLCGRAYN